jgi:hypothetical protein
VSGWASAPQDHSRVSNINFDFKAKVGMNFAVGNCSWDIYRAPPPSKKKSNIKVDN